MPLRCFAWGAALELPVSFLLPQVGNEGPLGAAGLMVTGDAGIAGKRGCW